MKDVSEQQFGWLIAFIIPGFLAFWALTPFSQTMKVWLYQGDKTSVISLMCIIAMCLNLGLIVSAIRWSLFDKFMFRKLVRKRSWINCKDQETRAAFQLIINQHFRYYQFYSNTAVSIIIFIFARIVVKSREENLCAMFAGGSFAILLLVFAAKDCFTKYFERSDEILK